MSVNQPNSVDFVAWKPDSSEVCLVVADHLDWSNEQEHLLSLQNKLNAYLEFVESGQLARDFPEASGWSVQIEVSFLNEPPQGAIEHFLVPATKVAQTYGIAFSWKTGPRPPNP